MHDLSSLEERRFFLERERTLARISVIAVEFIAGVREADGEVRKLTGGLFAVPDLECEPVGVRFSWPFNLGH
jgi:hypothetical protein